MNKYKFIALDKEKKKIKGMVEAASIDELRKIIGFHDYYLIKYKKVKQDKKHFISHTVREKDVKELCNNMAMMLSSNQPLISVISILEATTSNLGIKEFLNYTKEELNKGQSFTSCVRKYNKYFSNLFVSMVDVGEKSGSLKEVFSYLSKYYENTEKIKSKIVNAMIYPSILLLMAVVIMFVMCLFVLPMYSDIFIDNNIDLPLYTMILFSFSNFLKEYFIFVILTLILVFLSSILFVMSKKGKSFISLVLSKLPFISKIYKLFYIYIISSSLEIMLSNNISLIDSLKILITCLNNSSLVKKFKWILDEIRRGVTFYSACETSGYFPKMFVEMVKNGEITNNLTNEVKSSSKFYFVKLNNTLSRLSIFIEPVLIILISLFVGLIMVCVFMPMLGLLSNIS